jgi:hypothetical protein
MVHRIDQERRAQHVTGQRPRLPVTAVGRRPSRWRRQATLRKGKVMPDLQLSAANTPDLLVTFLEERANTILRLLAQPHGFDQGTYDAALAEYQGAQILDDSAEAYQHGVSMRNAASAVIENRDLMLKALQNLRQMDPQAASTAARSLEPVLNEATKYGSLARDTEKIMLELESQGAGQRLAGIFLTPQGRTSAALVSNQLAQKEIELLPQEVAQLNWVQSTLSRIRDLPISPEEVRARAGEMATKVSTFAAGVRGALVGARAAVPSALDALLIWLTEFGSRLTSPFIVIGHPFDRTGEGA